MPSDREILIRVSLGDVRTLLGTIAEGVTQRRRPSLRTWWWLFRETRRRGTWKPFTVGDYVLLRRKRAHMAHWPRRTPWPEPWRHYAQQRPGKQR